MDVPHVKVPVSDITIREAASLTDDGDLHYLQTMPPVLASFPGVTPAVYWDLTVVEHQMLVDWLLQTDVIKPADNDEVEEGGT